MSARRRSVKSSSQGELSVFNQIRPIDLPVDFFGIKNRPALVTNVKPRKEEQRPRRRVSWTLGLPETGGFQSNKKKVDDGFCGFLKACSLCKKKLEETVDVYMYGCLCAFCSPDCRDDQIALDGFDTEVSKEPTKMAFGGLISTKDRQGYATKGLK